MHYARSGHALRPRATPVKCLPGRTCGAHPGRVVGECRRDPGVQEMGLALFVVIMSGIGAVALYVNVRMESGTLAEKLFAS
jgi:hypothetical protein